MRLPSFLVLGLTLTVAGALRGETELERAMRLAKAGDPKAAQEVLERLVAAEPKNADGRYQLAKVRFQSGQTKEALEAVEQAIALQPARTDFHVLRGNLLGNQAGKASMFKALGLAKEGLAELEKAVQMEPAHRGAREALFNWYLNAPALGGGGKDKALAFADQTVALLPGLGHYFRAQVFFRKKDPGAVQKEARLAVGAEPTLGPAYNLLGYAELEMKQLDMALADFRKQVEVRPEDPNSYDSLGDGLMAKGQVGEAVQAYRKALELNPKFWDSAAHLGVALERAGQRDEAIAHYRRYVQLSTQNGLPAVANRAKEALKRLGAAA